VKDVCVWCVCVCVCVRCVWVCVVVVVWFPFRGDGDGGFAGVYFVSVLWSLLIVVVCVFGLCWLSSWQGVARFLCWVVLLLVRLLARFHCVVYVGVGLSWMRYFCF